MAIAAWLLLAASGSAPAPAQAEVERVEAVGVVPLKRGQGSAGALDAAIQAGLREAVSGVAKGLLLEADPSEGVEKEIEKALGKRMVPYTSRFRILDDQGERPAMFSDEPGVTSEYVVVVEVFVESDRVEQRLVEAGLLKSQAGALAGSRMELEVRGVEAYGAYAALRALLDERTGVRSAIPRSFETGTAVLDVQLAAAAGGATALFERMTALAPPGLVLRAIELHADRSVIEVYWTAPAPAEVEVAPARVR